MKIRFIFDQPSYFGGFAYRIHKNLVSTRYACVRKHRSCKASVTVRHETGEVLNENAHNHGVEEQEEDEVPQLVEALLRRSRE